MAINTGPTFTTAGLLYYFDASNPRCYPSYGTTVYSLHDTSVTGTMVGDTFFQGNGVSAFRFYGNNDRIEIPITLPTAASTYDGWFYLNAAGTGDGKANPWNTIFDSGTERPLIGTYNNIFYVYPQAYAYIGSFVKNTWYHIQIVIRSDTSFDIWLDGFKILANASYGGYNFRTGTYTTWLGGDTAQETSDSWIAIAAMYNRALTDDEVINNHLATKNRFGVNRLGSVSNPASSPQQLQDLGYSSGNYYIQGSGMSSAMNMTVRMRYIDNRPWVTGFASPYGSTATVNLVGNSIPWKGFAVQRQDTSFRQTAYFNSAQLFNARGDTSTATGGTRAGYRVFIGQAGGMGIYTTGQNVCSWGNDTAGAVGAGWDSSTCGSFPNGLIWGTGTGSSAVYDNRSGNWEVLIWWD